MSYEFSEDNDPLMPTKQEIDKKDVRFYNEKFGTNHQTLTDEMRLVLNAVLDREIENFYTEMNEDEDEENEIEFQSSTSFVRLEKLLRDKYDIRYNLIRNIPELRRKNSKKYKELTERFFNSIIREVKCHSVEFENANSRNIEIIFTNDRVENYNPILEYFEDAYKKYSFHVNNNSSLIDRALRELPYDFIYEMAQTVKLKNNPFNLRLDYFLRQYLIQVVYCVLDGIPNENVLIFQSKEVFIGKTFFMRKLYPPALEKIYIKEGVPDLHNKDGDIDLSRFMLFFIDEIDLLSKKQFNAFKSYTSRKYINTRLPFARLNSFIDRRVSFLGCCNSSDFIHDDDERRFLIFNIDSVDTYKLNDLDIDLVWGQAYHYYLNHKRRAVPSMPKDKVLTIRKSNSFYQNSTLEEDLVEKHCIHEVNEKTGEILSKPVTHLEIINHIIIFNENLKSKIDQANIRKALRRKFGEPKSIWIKENKSTTKGYHLTLV
ncbi:MAG: hypothetical protein KDH96_01820 [Candidatus Riesia sp.]|nr:hypothetical protein [Candidatus Riesia sp.]